MLKSIQGLWPATVNTLVQFIIGTIFIASVIYFTRVIETNIWEKKIVRQIKYPSEL